MDAVIFGDVGGHKDQFFAALETLGVDLSIGLVPEDLIVIQVGDLIHKGPDTEEIVALVDNALINNPNRWIQLFGNHEMQHINGYRFWNCRCSPRTILALNEWWDEGTANPSVGIKHDPTEYLPAGQTLITHAGLTNSWWLKLDKEGLAKDVAHNLNKLKYNPRELNVSGIMLGGAKRRFNAGPIWAHSTEEVYPSWASASMPFNQIHGHTAPFSWEYNNWYPATNQKIRNIMQLDRLSRVSYYRAFADSIGVFAGVDPGFGTRIPNIKSMPYLRLKNVTL